MSANASNVVEINLVVKDGNSSAVVAKIKQDLKQLGQEGKTAGENISHGAGHAVSDLQATSAATRLLQGDMSRMMRTTEVFLSSVPGLASALKVAFPVIGAATLAYMIGNLTGKVLEFQKQVQQVPRNIADAFNEAILGTETSTDNLIRQTDITNAHIAAMLGHDPDSSSKLAIDDLRLAADELAKSAFNADRQIKEILSGNKIGALGVIGSALLPGKTRGSTDVASGDVTYYANQLEDMSFAAQQAYHKGDKVEGDRLTFDYKKRREEAIKNLSAKAQNIKDHPDQFLGDQSASISVYEGAVGIYQAQEDNETAGAANKKATETEQALEHQKEAAQKNKEAQQKAMQDRLRGMEDGAVKEELFYGKSIFNAREYWHQYAEAFTAGSAEYLAVQEKINAAANQVQEASPLYARYHKLLAESSRTATDNEHEIARGDELGVTWQRTQGEDATHSGPRYRQYNQEQAAMMLLPQEQNNALDEQTLKLQSASGQISRYAAAVKQAQIHDAEWAVTKEKLNDELNVAQGDKDLQKQDPAAYQTAVQAAQAKLMAAEGQYQLQQIGDRAAIDATGLTATWRQSMDIMVQQSKDTAAQIGDIFTNVINSLNDTLADNMTAKFRTSRERWKSLRDGLSGDARGVASNLAKAGLQKAEGGLLGAFGLGKPAKRGDTRAMPLYVEEVGRGSAVGALLPGQTSTSISSSRSGIGGLFSRGLSALGGLLGGAPAMFGSGGADPLGLNAPNVSGVAKALGAGVTDMGLFQGFFANGGPVVSDRPAIVGENGPEMIIPRSSSTIIPNHQLGGSTSTTHHWHIDARGSHDPAAVNAAIMRAAPHIAAMANAQARNTKLRKPSSAA